MNDGTTSWSPDGGEGERISAAARMPGVGDLLGGRFLLRKVLGTGGSGVVFAATDVQLDELVAVKVLYPHLVDAQGLERLRREVRAARGGNPHTAAVHDLHSAGGVHFLSMELVEGESLRERLRSDGLLPVDEVIRVGRQIASALAHLHGRGVVHRDVKPGNILLTADGTAKLCDMGLARPLERGLTVTETAMVVGTPAYMGPEQATGAELVPASDVYALGLTLYQALTGKVPLTDDTALSTLMRRQKERPSGVRSQRPECPRWLGRLLARMLLPGPAERPSAAAVERALERRRYALRPRRRTVAAAALVVAVAAAIPIAYSVIRQRATVRVEVAGSEVHGVDATGRVTWRHPLGGPIIQSLHADLDGDGRQETVVASSGLPVTARDGRAFDPARIVALGRNGRVLTAVKVADIVPYWDFPYRKEFIPSLSTLDLDGDGRSELIANCRHPIFYPTVLLVYWPRWDRWDQVLEHSGYIDAVASVPNRRLPTLCFVGVNNRLSMLRVVGEFAIVPPSGRVEGGRQPLMVDSGLSGDTSNLSWGWYTPLSTDYAGPQRARLLAESQGDLRVDLGGGHSLVLDRNGNPRTSPNAGHDLRQMRLVFLRGIGRLAPQAQPTVPAGVRELAARLREQYAPLFQEPAYDAILGVRTARALARAGDLGGAIAFLQRTIAREPYDDLVYRLANLDALNGELLRAASTLHPIFTGGRTSRGYDAALLWLRLAIELHDRRSEALAVIKLLSFDVGPSDTGITAALNARAHLWWDDVSGADCDVASRFCEPAGAALACLARWRLGRTAASDPETMRRDADVNPDAGYEFQIALAAAQLGRAHTDEALATLEPLIDVLGSVSKDDFSNHQLLDLARALHCTALAAAGRRKQAAAEASKLLPTLTPGLLPMKLCREAEGMVAGTQP